MGLSNGLGKTGVDVRVARVLLKPKVTCVPHVT